MVFFSFFSHKIATTRRHGNRVQILLVNKDVANLFHQLNVSIRRNLFVFFLWPKLFRWIDGSNSLILAWPILLTAEVLSWMPGKELRKDVVETGKDSIMERFLSLMGWIARLKTGRLELCERNESAPAPMGERESACREI